MLCPSLFIYLFFVFAMYWTIIANRGAYIESHLHRFESRFSHYHNSLPEHVFPSPVNPALQPHAYDPAVLLHTALTSQLWELVEHSSISAWERVNCVELENHWYYIYIHLFVVFTKSGFELFTISDRDGRIYRLAVPVLKKTLMSFHVVVVQGRQRNVAVQKSVMHV